MEGHDLGQASRLAAATGALLCFEDEAGQNLRPPDRGALAGVANLTFTVGADFSISPDDPAEGPAYTGTYVEGGAGSVDTATDEGRATTYHVVASATGCNCP